MVELPAQENSVQIVAGYTSGGLSGFASTAAARSLLVDAYAAGSQIDTINEPGRTGFRITAPQWALPNLTSRLAKVFEEVPAENARSVPSAQSDFRAKVEEEIRSALLGPAGFAADYATENAFVLVSAPLPDHLRERLSAIPRRSSAVRPAPAAERLTGERTLRFKPDLPAGAVIFASPITAAYYKQWFAMLLLDKLIHRIVPIQLASALPLTVHPHYYRLETAVPSGQFPEPVEEKLLQELQRLQFTRASARDLMAAQQDALTDLESRSVREWFASHDLLAQRSEGMQWIESMSADDMRVAARDLLIMNRVIVTWPPQPKQTTVSAEPLDAGGAVNQARAQRDAAADDERTGRSQGGSTDLNLQTARTVFPAHSHGPLSMPLAERLASGVSIVPSAINAVFVSGGTISRFDRELTADDLKSFQQYRPNRILVLAPPAAMDRARQLWTAFKGSATGDTGFPRGRVSGGDLPALFLLQTILELKLLETGWFGEASITIDASEGSDLQIRASDRQRTVIGNWIKAVATGPIADEYFAWVREIAIHRFEGSRADLQSLLWDRDRQGTLQDLDTVSARHVQDVARIYF